MVGVPLGTNEKVAVRGLPRAAGVDLVAPVRDAAFEAIQTRCKCFGWPAVWIGDVGRTGAGCCNAEYATTRKLVARFNVTALHGLHHEDQVGLRAGIERQRVRTVRRQVEPVCAGRLARELRRGHTDTRVDAGRANPDARERAPQNCFGEWAAAQVCMTDDEDRSDHHQPPFAAFCTL